MRYASGFVLVLLAVFLLSSCENLILSGSERITFALVIDDLALDTMVVHANVHDHDEDGEMLETIEASFNTEPVSGTVVWAEMTTLEAYPTSQRYHLIFWIDMNTNSIEDTGDRTSYAVFEVMPNASYSEARVFAVDLVTIE